jgi:cyanophycinase-like exopeptidase
LVKKKDITHQVAEQYTQAGDNLESQTALVICGETEDLSHNVAHTCRQKEIEKKERQELPQEPPNDAHPHC